MRKILSLITLTLLCACSHSPSRSHLLTVEVSPLNAEESKSLRIFQMNYENNQYMVEKRDSTWGSLTWPREVDDDQKIDFYAYNSGTFHYNEGNPYITFTADELLRSQKDLLVATHKDIAYSDADGNVSLSFSHACAMVSVNVNSESESVTVNSVVLCNVKTEGDYYYNEGWKSVRNTNGQESKVKSQKSMFYVIPQSKDSIQLEVNYTVDGTAKTKTFPLAGEWLEGKEDKIFIEI